MPTFGRRTLAGALLFWITPAAAAAGGLALAPLLALCGALGAPWNLKRPSLPALLVCAAAAWAALSLAWSPIPRPEQALKIVLIALAGLGLVAGMARLDARARGWVGTSLIASALMLAALLLIEAAFDMPFNRAAQPLTPTGFLQRNPGRGVLVLEVIGFCALAAALTLRAPLRWVIGALLAAAMAWLSPQFSFEANAAAFAVGMLAFWLGYAAPKLGPALVGGFWAAWLLAAPWVFAALSGPIRSAAYEAPLSWGMRLLIWDYAAGRAVEKPLIGWGLDASRSFRDPQELGGYEFASIPLHPHSFSLQVWLETGAVGALLFAATFIAAGLACARWCAGARLTGAAATACFTVLGMVWNLSYGAWQEWYMALPFIAAAAVVSLRRPESLETRSA
jgi:O-antigen ligase